MQGPPARRRSPPSVALAMALGDSLPGCIHRAGIPILMAASTIFSVTGGGVTMEIAVSFGLGRFSMAGKVLRPSMVSMEGLMGVTFRLWSRYHLNTLLPNCGKRGREREEVSNRCKQ